MTHALALALVLMLAAVGCASDGGLRVGVAATNTLGRVLQAVDADMAASQTRDRDAARLAHPDDPVGYGAALAADNARADKLATAWHAHGLLHLAVLVWQDSDNPALWPSAAACALDALTALGADLPATWRNALAVASAPLRAAGGRCEVPP